MAITNELLQQACKTINIPAFICKNYEHGIGAILLRLILVNLRMKRHRKFFPEILASCSSH
jgi:hypothetical protein